MFKFFSLFKRKNKSIYQCQAIGYNKFMIHGLDIDGDMAEINHKRYYYKNGVFTLA